jgi:hypothetical protein
MPKKAGIRIGLAGQVITARLVKIYEYFGKRERNPWLYIILRRQVYLLTRDLRVILRAGENTNGDD